MVEMLPAMLDYAPSSERSSVGGLFFKPSFRSLLLALLAAVAVAWLARRHDPWKLLPSIPAVTPFSDHFFTHDNHLIAWHPAAGIFAIDLATGRVDRTIGSGSASGPFFFRLDGGRRIALFTNGSTSLPVYDTVTGAQVDQITNPSPKSLPAISDDGTRLITRSAPNGYMIWSRTSDRGADALRPMWGLGTSQVSFARAGQRILLDSNYESLTVLDARDLHTVAMIKYAPLKMAAPGFRAYDLGDHVTVQVPFPPVGSAPSRFELRSTQDGKLLDSHSITGRSYVFWSPDLSLKAICVFSPGIWRDRLGIDFLDRTSGKLLKRHPVREMWLGPFFPDSKRYLATTYNGPHAGSAVYDLYHLQPIARLQLPVAGRGGPASYQFAVAPDNQTILAHDGAAYYLLRRTGRDCPESHLGVLAFPQTWLIILFVCTAALSLFSDARRSRSLSNLPPPKLLSTILFALALVLTLRFTLEACLGHLIYSGAPALLLCSIGLATGSRIWRFLTLAALCATLPLYLYYLNQMRNTGLRTIQAWPLFDRIYEVPQSLPFAIILLATVAVLAAIVQLARPRPALLQ